MLTHVPPAFCSCSKEFNIFIYLTYKWSYKLKYDYLINARVVLTFRGLCFLQLDAKFTIKQQKLAKNGSIEVIWICDYFLLMVNLFPREMRFIYL